MARRNASSRGRPIRLVRVSTDARFERRCPAAAESARKPPGRSPTLVGWPRAYDVVAVEQQVAAPLGGRGHLPDRQRRPPGEVLRAVHVPLPLGAGPPGPRAELHLRRPGRPLPDHAGQGRAQPHRVRLVRPPGRERRHQDGDPPADLHRRPDRRAQGVAPPARRRLRLAPRGPQPRPLLHPVEPADLPPVLEAGLAYRAKAPVNWCPGCQTVLANEQVLPTAPATLGRPGRSSATWSSGSSASPVRRRAARALDDLDWPERVKTMQRNWIGRSEGAEFDLPVEGRAGR